MNMNMNMHEHEHEHEHEHSRLAECYATPRSAFSQKNPPKKNSPKNNFNKNFNFFFQKSKKNYT
jgi:hypothetical protein